MRHLYLHVPFCVRRCSYCDFSIAVRREIPVAEYVDSIRRELALRHTGGGALDTLYLGGGTPSLLPGSAIRELLHAMLAAFPETARDGLEVTLEANPEDVTHDKVREWSAAGVNRVSLGAQSFDDRVLQWMHRSHDAARIGAAVGNLRAEGITNVSLDLIFAVPPELGRDWTRDLDLAVALEPAHLSLYGLTVEERTPLARWINRGAISGVDEDRYARDYLLAHDRLSSAGFRFYEVSNAARAGRRSAHNSAYWSGAPYLGLGPAAHSFDGRARSWNVAPWEGYRRAMAAGRLPAESEEVLTPAQRELERLYLRLRTDRGLPLEDVAQARATVDSWRVAGWIEIRDGVVVCTPEGWLRLDALISALTGLPVTV